MYLSAVRRTHTEDTGILIIQRLNSETHVLPVSFFTRIVQRKNGCTRIFIIFKCSIKAKQHTGVRLPAGYNNKTKESMRLLSIVSALAIASASTTGMNGIAVGILAFIILIIAGVRMHVNEQRSRFHYEDKV